MLAPLDLNTLPKAFFINARFYLKPLLIAHQHSVTCYLESEPLTPLHACCGAHADCHDVLCCHVINMPYV